MDIEKTKQAKNIILKIENISKAYGGVQALSNVNLDIVEGEVHALVGENGAGKSTLIKILSGAIKKDTGKITISGKEAKIFSTAEAYRFGISCIYQELNIVPLLNVSENLFIGNLPLTNINILKKTKLKQNAQELLNELELNVSPQDVAGELSIAQQQMIEIGRAISRESKILIMDEPTSSLTDKEKEVLFRIILNLKKQKISIIYVSHKLYEIKEISDRITVLRDGLKIDTVENDQISKNEIIQRMIGREIDNFFIKKRANISNSILRVEHLTRLNKFENIDFDIKKGEVVGFFGLVGSGRSEIAQSIFGIDKLDEGRIFIDNEEVKIRNAKDAIKQGISLIPENRKLQGLILNLSVLFNMTIVKLKDINIFGHIIGKQERDVTEMYINTLKIKTSDITQAASNLSGGNQQKVVIAKWLSVKPKIIILDEPTRGVDVGAKTEIYSIIGNLAKNGVGLMIISSELPELIGICDRIITISEGKIASEFKKESFERNLILKSAFGVMV